MSDLDIDYGAGDSDAEDGISLGGYEDPVVPTAAEDLQVAEVENVVEAIVQPAAAVTASAPVKEEALPEPKTPPRRQPIAGTDWVAKESKSFGGHYYSNLKTGETTWEKPPEIVRAEEAAAAVVAVVRSPTPEPPPPLKLQQQPTGLAALPPKPVFDRPTSTKPLESRPPPSAALLDRIEKPIGGGALKADVPRGAGSYRSPDIRAVPMREGISRELEPHGGGGGGKPIIDSYRPGADGGSKRRAVSPPRHSSSRRSPPVVARRMSMRSPSPPPRRGRLPSPEALRRRERSPPARRRSPSPPSRRPIASTWRPETASNRRRSPSPRNHQHLVEGDSWRPEPVLASRISSAATRDDHARPSSLQDRIAPTSYRPETRREDNRSHESRDERRDDGRRDDRMEDVRRDPHRQERREESRREEYRREDPSPRREQRRDDRGHRERSPRVQDRIDDQPTYRAEQEAPPRPLPTPNPPAPSDEAIKAYGSRLKSSSAPRDDRPREREHERRRAASPLRQVSPPPRRAASPRRPISPLPRKPSPRRRASPPPRQYSPPPRREPSPPPKQPSPELTRPVMTVNPERLRAVQEAEEQARRRAERLDPTVTSTPAVVQDTGPAEPPKMPRGMRDAAGYRRDSKNDFAPPTGPRSSRPALPPQQNSYRSHPSRPDRSSTAYDSYRPGSATTPIGETTAPSGPRFAPTVEQPGGPRFANDPSSSSNRRNSGRMDVDERPPSATIAYSARRPPPNAPSGPRRPETASRPPTEPRRRDVVREPAMAMAIDLPSQEMIRKTSQQKSPPLPPQELVTGRSPGKGWPGQPLPVVSKEDEEEEDILHKVRKFREASRKKQQQQQQQPVEDAGTSRNVPEGLGIDVKPANGVDVVEEKQQPAEDLGTSRHVPQTITDRPSSTNNDILTKLGGNGSQGISLKGRSLQASGSSSSTIPQIRREPDQDEEDNVNGAAAEEGAASQETETTTTKARARKGGSAPRATKKRRKA